ncbi:MAG: metallophosphoesterase family protein [Armatimonadetes bacterium]|nr:metallophosphoesterase family protein [Armatimonadota bacterium]
MNHSRGRIPALCAALVCSGALFVVAQQPRPAQTQTVSPAQRFPEKETYRPTPVPDRIILTFAGDPTVSQAVTWRTDTSITRAYAEIAEADGGPAFAKEARRLDARTESLTTDLSTAHYHSVYFTGLQPKTQYAYRVGDGQNWSEWFHFRTAGREPEPFSFVYFGDAQNDLKSMWSRVVRDSFREAPQTRFLIHAGDLINSRLRDAEWGEWHHAAGWVNGMVPSVPTPGNHEYGRDAMGRSQLAVNWRPQFTLPENGPARLPETAYFLDYQGVRIISLNSNERQDEQAAWLDGVLRENRQRWTVVTFHHPIFSSARGRDNVELRRLWQPVLEKHRVDLVLTGHDHTYARSNLQTGVAALDPEGGTVYVVSVSGPKMYNVERLPWMSRMAEDTQLYQVISVDGSRLRYEARMPTGALYDAFELRKRPGRPNQLIERTPKDVPLRLRVAPPAPAAPAPAAPAR